MKFNESDLLTICVPTCDQVVILCDMLEDMIPKINRYRIRLLIIDNCSSDNTQNVVASYFDRYERLSYVRLDDRLEKGSLFETALNLAQTPYCWVIRDINRLNADLLSSVITELRDQSPDLYVLNYNRKDTGISSRSYKDANAFLQDLGWCVIHSGSVIFSRKIIDIADFKRYKNTHFFNFNIIFDALARLTEFRVFWSDLMLLNESPISCDNSRNPRGVFRIYGVIWSKTVLALPDEVYSRKAKLRCIRMLGKKTRLYTAHHLKRQRVVESLTPEIYKECYDYIRYFAPGNELRFFLYARYPNKFNKYYRRYHRYYKNTGLPLF